VLAGSRAALGAVEQHVATECSLDLYFGVGLNVPISAPPSRSVATTK